MPPFGLKPWGISPYGGSAFVGQPEVVEEFRRAESGAELGSKGDLGKLAPERIISVSEFENSIFTGSQDSAVSGAHVRAYIQTFATTPQHQFGSPAAAEIVVRAKSWVFEPKFVRQFFSDFYDISAYIKTLGRAPDDLPASIRALGFKDLFAFLQPHNIFDLSAFLSAIGHVDLPAFAEAIPSVQLPANVLSIPSVNLGARGGGHFPENLIALLSVTQPVNLPVLIRGVFGGSFDLPASLNQVGAFVGLQAIVKTAVRGTADLGAAMKVIAKGTLDLPALLQPYNILDLPATIVTQRVYDIRAIILGFARDQVKDLSVFLRPVRPGSLDLPVTPVRAVISTHTSSKGFNLTKASRGFFANRYVFGTPTAGLTFLTLEPIYGYFPDLRAEIFAKAFSREVLGAFIRVVASSFFNMPATLSSVIAFANINRVVLDLVPLINIKGDLIQVGQILPIRATVASVHKGQTSTDPSAGFITTATAFKFILGTNRGLFIPPIQVPKVRIETYNNPSNLPDLHATIAGWNELNLGAHLNVYGHSPIAASIFPFSIDHISYISAFIESFHTFNLGASLTRSGDFTHILAQLDVFGASRDLPANIVPFINPISLEVITVSTTSAANLGAIINYSTIVRCASISAVKSLTAFIKPIVTGTVDNLSNLSAEILSGRIELDLPAEIISRKRTRVHVITLTFRSKIRDTVPIRGSITPVIPDTINMGASILGLLHEFNLPATLTPVRFAISDTKFTAIEKVVDLMGSDNSIKEILLSFRRQVQFYVFENITNAVYSTDRGTWAIDLRSLIRDDSSFFDRDIRNREVEISDLQEYYSLDEAIRASIVLLCERQQFFLGASIVVSGQIKNLGAQLGIISVDRMAQLPSKIVPVANLPDISAAINLGPESSSVLSLFANLTPLREKSTKVLGASIYGRDDNDLGASITGL